MHCNDLLKYDVTQFVRSPRWVSVRSERMGLGGLGMKIAYAVAAAGFVLASNSSMAAIEIRAVPSVSNVLPGQEFAIQLLIDGDTTTPGDQPVPNGGLMSAGVS